MKLLTKKPKKKEGYKRVCVFCTNCREDFFLRVRKRDNVPDLSKRECECGYADTLQVYVPIRPFRNKLEKKQFVKERLEARVKRKPGFLPLSAEDAEVYRRMLK